MTARIGWLDGPEPVVLGFDGSAAPGGDGTVVAVGTLSGRVVTIDFTEVDLRPIIARVEQAVAQLAAATLSAPERNYPADSLHPANRLEWLQTVEGRTADGAPLVVCEHCGEPVPCVEAILRHMDTQEHRWCLTAGFCHYAGTMLNQLPNRS